MEKTVLKKISHDWDHILKSGFLFQAIFKQSKLNLINNLQQGEREVI